MTAREPGVDGARGRSLRDERLAAAMGDTDPLDGWQAGTFSAAGISHDTYRKGSGPGVVVVPEMPGITPAVIAFAEELVAAGSPS